MPQSSRQKIVLPEGPLTRFSLPQVLDDPLLEAPAPRRTRRVVFVLLWLGFAVLCLGLGAGQHRFPWQAAPVSSERSARSSPAVPKAAGVKPTGTSAPQNLRLGLTPPPVPVSPAAPTVHGGGHDVDSRSRD